MTKAPETTPTPTRTERIRGKLALGGSVVGIGSAFIFVRLSEVDPTATLMLRMLAASMMIGAVLAPRSAAVRVRDIRGRDMGLLVLVSIVSGLDLLANQWAVSYTSVANAAFLMNASPVFVLLFARLVYRERVGLMKLVAVVVAVAGGTLVVAGGGDQAPSSLHAFGDGLALTSAALYAVFLLMTKRLRERIPTSVIMLTNSLVIMVMLAPVAMLTSDPLLPKSASGYALIFGYALVCQLLGHGLMTYALRTVDPALASMSGLLRPVVAAALAWLILDEGMGPLQFLGGAVMLLALYCFQRADLGRAVPSSATTEEEQRLGPAEQSRRPASPDPSPQVRADGRPDDG
ncbi:DMT family transporter [Streptomyces candidus]|uniref:Drug/metabolite transporter (DMT)-like permease n=1 Tax=Streptomyces candidus TaxID=67283 RepID=A0A7X0LP68_9ACTN|nr:DMT family transporter [Streptomyces candidus]MBB6435164.1 drug/metabolite transporter (DMT)-like permease [Streptomyces candidus]GHH40634.1 membrane protein [Streptomyces candidus]